MSLIIAILIFSLIILFHELGHFLLAKANGITVVEFSLGMGPKLLSFDKGGTKYCLKILPFGGSCMMLGEDEGTKEPGAFGAAPIGARIAVIAAGPIFNFILAFLLSLIIIGSIGYDKPVIQMVNKGYPAQEAGLKAGDVVKQMNGTRIHVAREVTNYVNFHQGQDVTMVVERGGKDMTVKMSPAVTASGRAVFGIYCNSRIKCGVLDTIKYGAYEVKYWIQLTIDSLKMLFKGKVSVNEMSGPVGVVSYIGETYEESHEAAKSSGEGNLYVWLNMLNISVLLTANLGVMNLLPIPALDGGRLVFLIIELIRGKAMDPDKEGMVHFIGLMALLALMVFVMINDIRKLF